MEKYNDSQQKNLTKPKESTLLMPDEKKIFTSAIFAQCILPIKALPEGEDYYHVQHGNTNLTIQAGIIQNQDGKIYKAAIPSGPKARLILPYIINSVKSTGNPTVDMGKSLRQYMEKNGIPVGGANAKEISRQVHNIAASNIYIGIHGSTETHSYSCQKNYRIAQEISFFTERDPDQLAIWNPYFRVSDEFIAAAVDSHSFLLDFKPLIELQASPRAMDMYIWLSYRLHSVKHPVKIPYKSLFGIFGKQTKSLGDFKRSFKAAIHAAIPYVLDADIDLESDKEHIIIRNNRQKHIYMPSNSASKELKNHSPVEAGIFEELQTIGLKPITIKKLSNSYEINAIEKATLVLKQNMRTTEVDNPDAFITKALKEKWEPRKEKVPENNSREKIEMVDEDVVEPIDWRNVRKLVREKIGDALFYSWILNLEFKSIANEEVVLKHRNNFVRKTINSDYLSIIENAWEVIKGEKLKVSIILEKDK